MAIYKNTLPLIMDIDSFLSKLLNTKSPINEWNQFDNVTKHRIIKHMYCQDNKKNTELAVLLLRHIIDDPNDTIMDSFINVLCIILATST